MNQELATLYLSVLNLKLNKKEMSLLELARSLNCTEIISVKKELREICNKQLFSYLLIIDFESTCWDKSDKHRGYAEIIEFPCVLYDVKNNTILTHYQQYVMPTENPNLSSFCTTLTGITQNQVDNGVPLKTCMMLFKRWLDKIKVKYGITFETDRNRCIFATWSDWDLGNCLKNESRRKQIVLPAIFDKWIDIRALYRMHYMRRPKGLLGALHELGLTFEGREHCGLDDSKNTAKLVGRMVIEGVKLVSTNDLEHEVNFAE